MGSSRTCIPELSDCIVGAGLAVERRDAAVRDWANSNGVVSQAERRPIVRAARLLALAGLITSSVLGAVTATGTATAEAVSAAASPSLRPAADHSLAAVACTDASNCWAVGDYGPNDVIYSGLVEHWNGAKWVSWKAPNPTTATALYGVSCVTASDCWAAGSASSGPPSDSYSPVAEYWDGHVWQAATPLSPSAFSSFDAVDCTSRTNCWYVGSSYGLALIERWADVTNKGPEWFVEITPSPRGVTRSSFTSVTCATASDCWAMGYYRNSSNVDRALAERWNGSKWTLEPTPNLSGSTLSILDGVACTSRTNCWAIGYYANRSDVDAALAEQWNGTKWKVKAIPGASRSVLNGIACTGSKNCTAIGYYGRGSDIFTLAEQWNGTKWKQERTPNPSRLTLSELNGIACPKISACWAVGDSGKTQQTPSLTLAEHGNRTKWGLVRTPNP
jgi:hypothetical protein